MDFTTVKDITLPGNLTVKKMQHGNDVLWKSGGGEDYSTEPMFFENTTSTNGTVSFVKANESAPTIEVFTSTDNSTWTSAGTTDTTAITATLPANGRLYVRATADRWGSSSSNYNKISVDANCTLNGNILSLLYADGFSNYTEFPNNSYMFENLFENNTTITSAEHLIMPSNVTSYCYQYMFYQCTALTTAPVLPATSLTSYCYRSMFYGCTNLNYVKALFTSWSSLYTSSWLSSVALTGTMELSGDFTGTFSFGASGKPSNWDVIYSYLSGVTISQTDGETVRIVPIQYCSDVIYTVQPSGGSEGSPVTVSGPVSVEISEDCTIRAYETDDSGDTSSVSTFNAVYSIVYKKHYFFVEDVTGSNNTLSIKKSNASAPTLTIYKSTDGTTWDTMGTTGTTAITATVPANGKLFLKCTADAWAHSTYIYHNEITCSGLFNVGGNILSLLKGDSYKSYTTISANYVFRYLFQNSKVRNAENLILPNNTTTGCYQYMFYQCTSLLAPPELPASTLNTSCYEYMFSGCTNLRRTPYTLKATTTKDNCYARMFQSCTMLTSACELPATSLAKYAYIYMFSGCTSLVTAPVIKATTFSGQYACNYMFSNCSRLNYIKAMFTATPGSNYTTSWVNGVAATGTFVKNASASWNVTGTSGIPSGWTVETAAS